MRIIAPMMVLIMMTSTLAGCTGGDPDGGGNDENGIDILSVLINEKGDSNQLFDLSLEDGEWLYVVSAQSVIFYDGEEMLLSSFLISDEGFSPGVKSGGNYSWCTMRIENSGCYNDDPDGDWILLKWSIIYFVTSSIIDTQSNINDIRFNSEWYNLSGDSSNLFTIELQENEWLQIISAQSLIQYEGYKRSVSSFLISDNGFSAGDGGVAGEFGGNYSWCTMRIENSGCYNVDPDGDWELSRWEIVYMVNEVTTQEP